MNAAQRDRLRRTLSERFAANASRHPGVRWDDIAARLDAHDTAFAVLDAMESTGGEPDVIVLEPARGTLGFVDCSAESPAGRRSLCFDDDALAARKTAKPRGSALGLATSMGIELLDEAAYRRLQSVGAFDTKTSSWLATPAELRGLGGALFGDRRYDRVFTYHNGAQSYYAARGFRGLLRI